MHPEHDPWDEIRKRAATFSERWKNAASEKSESQLFVHEFLAVFDIDAWSVGRFEKNVLREDGRPGEMDYFFSKNIAIEMKSKGVDLKGAYRQLKDYVVHLPADEMPRLLMVCDFENIVLYHRSPETKKQSKPIAFNTKDLCDHVEHFHTLVGLERLHAVEEQFDVNVRAAELMADLHDDLERHGYSGHDLEVYLVRLLFCMFAEDTGIFPQDYFLSYVKNSHDLSGRMGKLFEVLNMPDKERDNRPLLSDDLKKFRYLDGGLFEKLLPSADFDTNMQQTLIKCCTFDWSKISPAIFGAMFQGVMDKNKRRELGVHYTSEVNIMKVIDMLFMDRLRAKFKRVKLDKRRLDDFHDEIAHLKFLDPACGCGNFLMIAYRELRKLEIEILRIKKESQKVLDVAQFLRVNVEQFYGIEIEDFPCEIARTGLWLMDHLMNRLATKELGAYYIRLPLGKGATIVHGNAHRIDWEDVVPKDELSYIISNPPYNGARTMTTAQKEDMSFTFGTLKGVGNLDYVASWYKKAAEMMNDTIIRAAFVSTNSITQGEQVAILWKPLMERGIHINFGVPTFKWTNEAPRKAAVHCVIIGFSYQQSPKHINPYLVEAPTVFIEARSKPLCDVPEMVFGSMPNDGGNLIIEEAEYKEFIRQEPLAKKFIRRFLGAESYINNQKRYCLWLVDATPSDLRAMPLVMRRVKLVENHRLNSKREVTRKLARTPFLFGEIRQPKTNFVLIPRISSERRYYIPIGFMSPKIIVSDAIQTIPNATLYHFGILTSSIHMAWTRAVCGRLEMRYNYSNSIVYNNFPWPDAKDEQKATIETLAQAVLDAREKFPGSSLADLYDPLTMPPELLKAHHALDHAVMKLYGFNKDASESMIVAALMERYRQLTTPPSLIPEQQDGSKLHKVRKKKGQK